MDYYETAFLIRYFCYGLLAFYGCWKVAKVQKKYKQLETDYNELLKQVELLIHENNTLKKHGTDMI